ncbi:MAG: 2-C-methyl-D-erythritol 4-phosphate cytidylyltransferase [Bacteroidota bacterium]
MKKFAVLVAGGSGSRMKTDLPKQFLSLKERPLLFYTINSFLKAADDISIILVLPQDFIEMGNEIINQYFKGKDIIVTAGGQTRFHSVKNGLQMINEDSVVLVHDVVRCLVTEDLINRSIVAAIEKGAVVPVISSRDSVRMITGSKNNSIERSTLKLVQTPQTFLSKNLISAFEAEYNEMFTDEAAVMEAAGYEIHLIEGEENNIKITFPIDFVLAEKILENK